MAATTKVIERKPRTFLEQIYLWEMFRGMGVTSRQFFRNIFTGKDVITVQYPEEQREYPKRYRGLHRLTYRDDGQVRCVACMCCSTACPADCIHIVAGEHEDPTIEKYPLSFVIDELRCIACGYCVEACPCDAIRMDTGLHCEPFTDRKAAFFDKHVLLDLGTLSHAVQGGRIKKTSGRGH
jgi:NADH-quinone oxidoreductase subunit I